MNSIDTERLRLRAFEDGDAEGLLAYHRDPPVNCFADEKLETLEEALKDVRLRKTDEFQFAVCLRDSDRIIGNVFADFEKPDTFGVGWFFNADYSGQGFATEAARAYCSYLFDERGARRIYAYVEDDNIPSQRLCERLGMRREALFREFISFVNNPDGSKHYEDTREYAILKHEWQQNN